MHSESIFILKYLNMLSQNGKTSINKGYVTQIIGPVLDVEFPYGNLPPIYQCY